MKGASKLTKKDQPKSDLTSNKESESSTNGGGVHTSATGTKQCEAITNVAIRIMRVKGMDEQC
jgi:hypothetical protein